MEDALFHHGAEASSQLPHFTFDSRAGLSRYSELPQPRCFLGQAQLKTLVPRDEEDRATTAQSCNPIRVGERQSQRGPQVLRSGNKKRNF